MNKTQIRATLVELKERFDSIFKLFDSPREGLSYEQNLKLISSQYSDLKEYVNSYYKDLKGSQNLTEDQRYFLIPAIRDVSLHCSARKGSMNRSELSSSLYEGADYCSYYIIQLND